VDLEVNILAQLQKILFGGKGPGKNNMLPVWICIWLLILTYRRSLDHLTPKKDNNAELAQQMYDMLVSVYSGLFKPSSPLWLNYLKLDVFELFGQDYRITHTMGTLKTEMNYIRKYFVQVKRPETRS
jgi:hypothetical protein